MRENFLLSVKTPSLYAAKSWNSLAITQSFEFSCIKLNSQHGRPEMPKVKGF